MLEWIEDDGTDSTKRRQANGLLKYFNTFDFVFYLQLMLLILGFTNSLSVALQRKDQDILNAMSLVKSTKQHLFNLRDDGWDSFLNEVFLLVRIMTLSLSLWMENLLIQESQEKKAT